MCFSFLPACSYDLDLTPQPEGPIAHNASEVWPDKPDVPPMTPEQMVRACASYSACELGEADSLIYGPVGVDMCLQGLTWSAERAVPISKQIFGHFGDSNERAEFFVNCTLNAKNCEEVQACITLREASFTCQEDGCRAQGDYVVTCEGDVAVMTAAPGIPPIRRDCSRAYAACDPSSPTGCTDRQFTACPTPPPQPDRCEGDERLGCDGWQQVSYRDCTRMGGHCTEENGAADCRYGEEDCVDGTTCEAGMLRSCLRGVVVTIEAPALCPAAED